jgi:hypothetical protein
VQGCGPDGGAVVGGGGGELDVAVGVGRGWCDRVRLGRGDDVGDDDGDVDGDVGAALDDGVADDGACDDTAALELGAATGVDGPEPPTDEVHAAAVSASPASPAASGARLNCRSVGRSSRAGCSGAVPVRPEVATTSRATPHCR